MASSTVAPKIACQSLEVDPAYQSNSNNHTVGDFRSVAERAYHNTAGEPYSLPNDKEEYDRLNIQDHMWKLTLYGGLHVAPVPSDAKRILEMGAGRGHWAIDYARAHPDCQLIGADISPVEALTEVPSNVTFVIANANRPWSEMFEAESMDFVHCRLMILGITDWTHFFREAYRTLQPGGWVEVQEVEYPLRVVDDGGVSVEKSKVYELSQNIRKACLQKSIDLQAAPRFEAMAAAQGFIDIKCECFGWPMGSWPKDLHDKEIGRLTRIDVGDLLMPAMGLRLLPEYMNWDEDQVREYVREAVRETDDRNKHFYNQLTICYAQKPFG